MSKEHDWREDRKKRLGLLDKHAFKPGSLGSMRRGDTAVTAASTPLPLSRKAEAASKEPERAFTEPQKRGLVVRQRESSTPPPTVIVPGDVTPPMDEDTPPPAETNSTEANEATDEDALRALLTGEETSKTNPAKLIIQQPSEEDMFRHDVDTRPEAPTLEAYSSMPIEEFGAAEELAEAPEAIEMPVVLWHVVRCTGAEELVGGAEDFVGGAEDFEGVVAA